MNACMVLRGAGSQQMSFLLFFANKSIDSISRSAGKLSHVAEHDRA